MLVRYVRIKRVYFDQIRDGTKTLEGRAASSIFKSIHTGATIRFCCGRDTFDVEVIDVRSYKTFGQMIAREPLDKLVPGMNAREALDAYNSIYAPDKLSLGAVVFELAPVSSAKR